LAKADPEGGGPLSMIYRYISLYIMGFSDLELSQQLRYDFVLPTLYPFFTNPASFLYRPCIPILPTLHPC